jgi:hypothetical protein
MFISHRMHSLASCAFLISAQYSGTFQHVEAQEIHGMTLRNSYYEVIGRHTRIALVALALFALSACTGRNHALQERIAYWQANLSEGVPVGSNRVAAMTWAASRDVQFQYVEEQHWLYAIVERVPESGIPYPCSQWNIILKVRFDSTGHSTKSDAGAVGSCL